MIKWLHQDLKGQMVTVPSSSIMKLASKSINVHPTVAALLKSVTQMGLFTASPFPIMHEDVDVELDLNILLEKQIEEINFSAKGFGKEITVDILEGFKGNQPHYFIRLIEFWFVVAICLCVCVLVIIRKFIFIGTLLIVCNRYSLLNLVFS